MRLIRLTKQDKARIQQILKRCLDREEVQSMQRFVQHGRTSTYAHSVNVVKLSYWLNKKFHLNADERALLTGALLHDFYLYDWHEKSDWHKWHGFSHPFRAAGNACRIFHIGKRERQIIESHMWPLTLRHVPETREAAIVCIADKCCSFYETVRR